MRYVQGMCDKERPRIYTRATDQDVVIRCSSMNTGSLIFVHALNTAQPEISITSPADPSISCKYPTSIMFWRVTVLRCEGQEGGGGAWHEERATSAIREAELQAPNDATYTPKRSSSTYSKLPTMCDFEHYRPGMRGGSLPTRVCLPTAKKVTENTLIAWRNTVAGGSHGVGDHLPHQTGFCIPLVQEWMGRGSWRRQG